MAVNTAGIVAARRVGGITVDASISLAGTMSQRKLTPAELERAKRLKTLRINAGWKSARRFALEHEEAFGVNESTYRSFENGNRPINDYYAEIYGKILGVDPLWLLYGERDSAIVGGNKGAGRPVYTVPVITWTQARTMSLTAPLVDVPTETLTVAYSHGNLFALPVRDRTMDRIAPEGAKIIVDPTDTKPTDGCFYIFEIGREVVFRRYRDRGGPPGLIRLEAYSFDPVDTIYPGKDFRVLGAVVEVRISIKSGSRA